jgi:hypothetical protein
LNGELGDREAYWYVKLGPLDMTGDRESCTHVSSKKRIMAELQTLSSIVPLPAIERPACPKCQAQMMLARIMPAFLGTDLHTFECLACNHVLHALGAQDDSMQAKERGRRL